MLGHICLNLIATQYFFPFYPHPSLIFSFREVKRSAYYKVMEVTTESCPTAHFSPANSISQSAWQNTKWLPKNVTLQLNTNHFTPKARLTFPHNRERQTLFSGNAFDSLSQSWLSVADLWMSDACILHLWVVLAIIFGRKDPDYIAGIAVIKTVDLCLNSSLKLNSNVNISRLIC